MWVWQQYKGNKHNIGGNVPVGIYNTAVFAFGSDAATRSEAEALQTATQAENREEPRGCTAVARALQ